MQNDLNFSARRSADARIDAADGAAGALAPADAHDARVTYIEPSDDRIAEDEKRARSNALDLRRRLAVDRHTALDGLRREALRLRARGYSYDRIAAVLEISPSSAYQYVKAALTANTKTAPVDANTLRSEMLGRLEFALECLLPSMLSGKPFAVEKWVMVNDRIAKLYGLDAPTQSQTITASIQLTPDERRQAIQKIVEDMRNKAMQAGARLTSAGEDDDAEVADGLLPGDLEDI